jgi:hypothetical protein
MSRATILVRSAASLLVCSVTVALVAASPAPPTAKDGGGASATLRVEMAGPTLAGFPIELQLTITNTGKVPLVYWCGGPGNYPGADAFTLMATDANGRTRNLQLDNGQHEKGSGADHSITSYQAFPAACGPLSPGTYRLVVAWNNGDHLTPAPLADAGNWKPPSSEPLTVTIRDDRKAIADAERDLLRRAKDNLFAKHVAVVYGIDPVVKKWLQELAGDDERAAEDAAYDVNQVRRLPVGGDATLLEAAKLQCRSSSGRQNRSVLRSICWAAEKYGTDLALGAVLTIAESNVNPEARGIAIQTLGGFEQKKVNGVLLDIAGQKDSPFHWDALSALAKRHNRAAIAPLVEEAGHVGSPKRNHAIYSLGDLRDEPTVRAALKAALADPDEAIRQEAKAALEREKE